MFVLKTCSFDSNTEIQELSSGASLPLAKHARSKEFKTGLLHGQQEHNPLTIAYWLSGSVITGTWSHKGSKDSAPDTLI